MREPDRAADLDGPHAVASYVAAMAADLALMARRSGLDTVGYLLEMVHLEAGNAVRPPGGGDVS